MKCTYNEVHISLALELMRFYCHTIRNMEIKLKSSLVILHYSLRENDLTATAAIALARALLHNQSLEELE